MPATLGLAFPRFFPLFPSMYLDVSGGQLDRGQMSPVRVHTQDPLRESHRAAIDFSPLSDHRLPACPDTSLEAVAAIYNLIVVNYDRLELPVRADVVGERLQLPV
jgi:hypothetical protein